MEGKICPKCDTWKGKDEYYSQFYKGVYKPDYSSCRVCRKIRNFEMKKLRDAKYINCVGCKREFGNELTHFSRGLCHTCHRDSRVITGNCKICHVEFGSGNPNQTRPTSKGRCKRCYEKWRKEHLIIKCKSCGDTLDKPSLRGVCFICKEKEKNKSHESLIKKGILKNREAEISKEQYDSLRILFVKFRSGYYSLVDTYKVATIFDELYGTVPTLDSKDPEIQVVLMLQRLKTLYDNNADKF